MGWSKLNRKDRLVANMVVQEMSSEGLLTHLLFSRVNHESFHRYCPRRGFVPEHRVPRTFWDGFEFPWASVPFASLRHFLPRGLQPWTFPFTPHFLVSLGPRRCPRILLISWRRFLLSLLVPVSVWEERPTWKVKSTARYVCLTAHIQGQ